jgi:hypothetical protein
MISVPGMIKFYGSVPNLVPVRYFTRLRTALRFACCCGARTGGRAPWHVVHRVTYGRVRIYGHFPARARSWWGQQRVELRRRERAPTVIWWHDLRSDATSRACADGMITKPSRSRSSRMLVGDLVAGGDSALVAEGIAGGSAEGDMVSAAIAAHPRRRSAGFCVDWIEQVS